MAKRAPTENLICQNKKAGLRYEILESLECGIVLTGTEVKSLRNKSASIEEAYVQVVNGELWLIGCHVGAYRFATTASHEPIRKRKLLAHTREVAKLRTRVEQKGMTLVPLKMLFNARGIAKVLIGVARGKKLHDRREDMKTRDHKREMERAMRRRR
jgi:SsrA-binding protein